MKRRKKKNVRCDIFRIFQTFGHLSDTRLFFLVNTRLYLVSFFLTSQNVYISGFFYHHPKSPAPDETVVPKSVAKVSMDKIAPGIRPLGSPE